MKEESKKSNKKQIFIYIVLFAIGLARRYSIGITSW